MVDLLKEIIAVDKSARERLEKALNDRAQAYASVASKKEELINEEKRKAKKKAESISAQSKTEGEKQFEKVKERNIEILKNMNKLYEDKKDEWVENIVKNVLSQH